MNSPAFRLSRNTRCHRWCRSSLALTIILVAADARAATFWWSGSGTLWTSTSAWSTTATPVTNPAAVPGSADDVIFQITSATTSNQIGYLNGNQAAQSLSFTTRTPNFTLLSGSTTNSTAQTLTLGSGGVNTNQITTIGNAANPVAIALAASQTWTNNTSLLSTASLNVNASIASSAASGTQTLTVTGGGRIAAFNGNISDGGSGGTIALRHTGVGTIQLDGTNTYSGTTTISGSGTLIVARANSLPGYNTAGRVSLANNTGSTLAFNLDSSGWSNAELDSALANVSFNSGNYVGLQVTTGSQTYSSTVPSGRVISKLGAGTLTLSGNATTLGSFFVGRNDQTTTGTNTVTVATNSTVSIGSGASDTLGVGVWNVDMPQSTFTSVLDLRNATTLTINVGTLQVGVANAAGVTANPKNALLQLPGASTITAATSFVIGDSGAPGGLSSESVTTTGAGTTTVRTPTMTIGASKATGSFTLGAGTLDLAGTAGGRTALGVGDFSNSAAGTSGAFGGTADFSAGTVIASLSSLVVGRMNQTLGGPETALMTLGTSSSNRLDVSGAAATNGAVVVIGRSLNSGTGLTSGTLTIGNLDSASQIVATDNGTAILLGSRTSTGNATGTLNLNGGTITITTTGTGITGGSGTSTVNFNGTTLKAGASSSTWITGLTTANVQSGGARLDSNGFDVTVTQAFSGTGGLVKLGSGTLSLTGVSTYTGTTSLNDGVVNLGSAETAGTSGPLGRSAAANPGSIVLAGGTLQYSISNANDYSGRFSTAANQRYNVDTNGRNVTWATNLSSSGGSLTKVGSGVLVLSGSNSYTGATTVSSGTLQFSSINALRNSSGVNIADGAFLRYSGAADAFNTNITVTSGTGTVTNSGGGTLTLSGGLSKNGTVLRLSGGAFNVTGLITGTSPNSDLVVAGTSTVTLSNTNTYNGPTFVNESSTLVLGTNNAIPNNSVVTLGNATTTGTLNMNGFTDAIGGLGFGSSGGTLRLVATSTSAAPLTSPSGTMTLTNGTLDLAGSGTSAGLYRVLSAQTVSGTFASITGTSDAYQVLTTASSVDYQQKAVLGALTVTNTVTSIITGGSAAFTYTVANNALSGGANLGFSSSLLSNLAGSSSGTAAAGGTSGAISGLVFTGSTIGAGQQGTFTVTAPEAFGATTATGTVSVNVLNHSLASFQSSDSAALTLNLGTYDATASAWTSGSGAFGFSVWNIASDGFLATDTAGLALYNVIFTSGTNIFSTGLSNFANLGAGLSNGYTASVLSPGSLAQGTYQGVYTLKFRDQQDLSGAINTRDLTLTMNVVVVPEPASIALAGVGIAAAAWALRRRQRLAQHDIHWHSC